MKHSFLILFFAFAFHLTYSQVGIGITTPSSSTILDIYASDKGVLFPRVALQGKNDVSTIANGNQQGLLVYNTNTVADVTPGFYHWDNVQWQRFSTSNTNYTGSTSIALNGNSFERAALTGDVTSPANSNTTTIANNTVNSVKIADGTVANVDLANMEALSVKSNPTNASAAPTDIAAANDGEVLRRSGNTLGFGLIGSTNITDNTITNADLNNGMSGVGGIYKGSGSLNGATTVTQGTNSLTFNSTAATSNPFSITANSLTTGTAVTISSSNAVTTGKLLSIIGNSITTGTLAEIQANGLSSNGIALNIRSSTGNSNGRLLNISYTGANFGASGRLFNIEANNIAAGSGILASVSGTNLTTGTAFSVTSNAGSGLTGNGRLMKITGDSQTSGTLSTISGTALTSGTALAISVGNELTTGGEALSVTTGNITAGSGIDITTGTLGTAGKALNISSNNNAANTEGVIKVTNTAASSAGIFATFNANNTAGSGLTILNNGDTGIGTNSPTALLDVNGDTIRIRNAKTPTSSTSPGNVGDIAWDSDFVYVCVATNTWKRSALSTW